MVFHMTGYRRFFDPINDPGYHEYKRVWDDPVDGEELEYKCEIGNSHDTHAAALRKAERTVRIGQR